MQREISNHGARLTSIMRVVVALGTVVMCASAANGQVTPTDNYPRPPDDTPSVRIGGTLFVDDTYSLAPKVIDVDGNAVTSSDFNVTRAYVNVTGQVNHLIAFRITPDVVRETGTGSSLAGSETFRLKYGYAQLNLDDWMWRASYVRVGMIQTPYVDFAENVYRYRFQGQVFVDREGYRPSSDFGAAFRTLLPGGYGEVVGGIFNGEGYAHADPNNQKAWEIRGTLRPLPGPGLLHGVRITSYLDADHYAKDDDRTRIVQAVTYEHRFVNAGFEYLKAADQTSRAAPRVESSGTSMWITPRILIGQLQLLPTAGAVRASVEGLLRYDRLEPDDSNQSLKQRWIAGVAFWPRLTATTVSSSFLLDYEAVRYDNFAPARPTERRLALHVLIAF